MLAVAVLMAAPAAFAGPGEIGAATPVPASPSTRGSTGAAAPVIPVCGGVPAALPRGPDYYAIDLVPTRRVPGTGNAGGTAEVLFRSSPFGVSISPAGTYAYRLDIRAENLPPRADSDYVAWVTTTEISEIDRLGVLGDDLRLSGEVEWNKFLVVITQEPSGQPRDAEIWTGPIILRGMSRSGEMHTMAGHGAFQAEPCAKYGFR